jgi:tetratricopeptide (TPR) repeat protein
MKPPVFRKKLNIKLLGCLLGAAALLGTVVHFLHAYQVRRNADVFVALADEARQRADSPEPKARAANVRQEVDYLGRYLALVPDDFPIRTRFALRLADKDMATNPRAVQRAYFVLGQVLSRDPSLQDVRRRVVDLAMDYRLQRFSDAQEHLTKLLETAPQDGELLGLLARCLEATGKYKDARAKYEKAIERRPAELENYLRLAYLLRERPGQVKQKGEKIEELGDRADEQINRMVEVNSKNFKAYLNRVHYRKAFARSREDQGPLIAKDVEEAYGLQPDDAEAILALAGLRQEQSKPDEARELLNDARTKHAKDSRVVQALARLELFQGRPDAALQCLRDGLKTVGEHPDLLWNYAYLLIQQRDPEAPAAIGRLVKVGMPEPELNYLRARIDCNDSKWARAARSLEHLYPHFTRGYEQRRDWFSLNLELECNLLLGRCYEEMGDPDRAATVYGRVVSRDPRSVAGRLGLARMKWSLGQLAEAESEYRQLLALEVKLPETVWVEMSQLLIVRNLREERSNWGSIKDDLDKAEKRPDGPDKATLTLLRAEVDAAQNDFSAARRHLEDFKDQKNVQIRVAQAGLALREEKLDEALAVLDKANRDLGDLVELRLARARYWSRRGGPDAARELARLGQNLEAFKNPQDQLRLRRGLADAYGQICEFKEAARLWRQIADERPSDLGSRLTLFDLALLSGDEGRLGPLEKEIEKLETDDHAFSLYCDACWRIWKAEHDDKSGLPEAAQNLKKVADRRPGSSRVWLALAQAEDLQGQDSAAAENYKRAVLLGEQRPAVIRSLVQNLTKRGHHVEAEEIVRRLKVQSPALLVGLERAEAELAVFRQNKDKALEMARKAVKADSTDYKDLIWLGQILWAAEKYADAEKSLRRALSLNDQVPETWVALVNYLNRTGERKRAEEVLREAEQKLPRGNELHLAQCWYVLGNMERADKLYEAAFKAHPEDDAVLYDMAMLCLRTNRMKEAERHLDTIIRLKSSAPDRVARAKRIQALLMASEGDYQKSQKAMEMLGSESAARDNVADIRTRVAILANRPGVADRRKAIELLEGLVTKKAASLDDRFALAQLYESVGDPGRSRTQMMGLLSAAAEQLGHARASEKKALQDSYAGYLVYHCLTLLRPEKLADAKLREVRAYQADLEAVEPGTFRSLEVKARLLKREGKAAEVVPSLKKLAATDDTLVRPVAALLDQIDQTAAAGEMYEHYVAQSKDPQAVLVLAAFLGRHDRLSEALALCEKAWKTCPPEAVSGACVVILHEAKSGLTGAPRVSAWIEQAIDRNPDKTGLLTDLAAVRRLQGRHQDAVELLRKISARDKSDPLALNNLAWLLALTGKGDEAIEKINTAIKLRGELAELLDTRAVAYLNVKGKHKDAVKDLEDAIAEMPTAHRYFHLAQAYAASGNERDANDALRRARALGLNESSVDPLELSPYRQLMTQLDRR